MRETRAPVVWKCKRCGFVPLTPGEAEDHLEWCPGNRPRPASTPEERDHA